MCLDSIEAVLGDVPQSRCRGFLDARVELLEALDESFERTRIDDCHCESGGVLSNATEDEGCGLFVEAVLFAERADKLGEDLV